MRRTVGVDVIDVTGAHKIGRVGGFVVDRSGTQVLGVELSGRRNSPSILAWSAITAIGDDAVMVDVDVAPTEAQLGALTGRPAFLRSRTLDTGGFELGEIDDATFDTSSGSMVDVTVGDAVVSASAIRGFGSYALVIESGT
jgi:uncharacterized protein YrrD